jgi:hypothetical protein
VLVTWYITNYADARRFLADPTVSRDAAAGQALYTGGELDAMPAQDPLESDSSQQRLLRFLRRESFGQAKIDGYRVAISMSRTSCSIGCRSTSRST